MKQPYPLTLKIDQSDEYHGTQVSDPYRWLEDVDAVETLEWVKCQNELTFAFLEKIPVREKLRKRLTELWDYAKAQAPVKHGGRYFQLRNTGLQNQDVLFVCENLADEPRLLLDPNTLSEDGTVALNAWEASPDHLGERLGLAKVAYPQRGYGGRPAGGDRVEQIQRCGLAEGCKRILLCPLRCSKARRGIPKRQLFSKTLLSPPGHAAERGYADL
jgi:hypothetical protein